VVAVRRATILVAALAFAPAAHAAPPAVSVQASPASGPAPLQVTLTAGGDFALYHWELGDGTTADGPSVQHVYTAGRFTARVTATSPTGETTQATVTVTSVGLTLAGTILADRLTAEIPTQLVAAGVPQPMVAAFAGGGGGGGALDITGTGDLGARILASLPDAVKPTVEPLIPNIVAGIHEAISIAIASTFWVGIVGAVIAAVFVLFLHEVPMRQTFEGGAAEPEESAA